MNWSLYNQSLTVKGDTRRDRAIFETQRSMNKRIPRSPGYKNVLIDGEQQNVVITSSTESITKNKCYARRAYLCRKHCRME